MQSGQEVLVAEGVEDGVGVADAGADGVGVGVGVGTAGSHVGVGVGYVPSPLAYDGVGVGVEVAGGGYSIRSPSAPLAGSVPQLIVLNKLEQGSPTTVLLTILTFLTIVVAGVISDKL